ncbi:MAG: stage sporulation protein, partial [Paenibacillus sp.]|nr:stage sporulation protein [Paenibacillus sp.]
SDLRDIIAVILLAVLVELLLPNKAMQRYARLVVGLFILLTILSPVLRLFQEDIGPKLDAGIRMWSERSADRNVKMPTLEEIERKAAELTEQRNRETAKLMERTLEGGMLAELRKTNGRGVEDVDVTLVWDADAKEGEAPAIGGVTVTLRAPEESAADAGNENRDVEEVLPVTVGVEVEASPDARTGKSESPDGEEGFRAVKGKPAAAIEDAIYQGWGVHRDRIEIRERA